MASVRGLVKICLVCLLCSLAVICEPKCSKYDYEEQVLHKMVRLEFQLEQMKEFLDKHTADTRTALKNVEDNTDSKIMDLVETVNRMKAADGYNKTLLRLTETVEQLKTKRDQKMEDVAILFQVRDKSADSVNGKILKFNTVLRNDGNGFDKTSGKFRAPVPGMYLFHLQLCVGYEKKVESYKIIKNNGTDIVLLSGKTFNEATGDTYCSYVGITDRVNAADLVWVNVADAASISTNTDAFMTTFSGTFLNP